MNSCFKWFSSFRDSLIFDSFTTGRDYFILFYNAESYAFRICSLLLPGEDDNFIFSSGLLYFGLRLSRYFIFDGLSLVIELMACLSRFNLIWLTCICLNVWENFSLSFTSFIIDLRLTLRCEYLGPALGLFNTECDFFILIWAVLDLIYSIYPSVFIDIGELAGFWNGIIVVLLLYIFKGSFSVIWVTLRWIIEAAVVSTQPLFFFFLFTRWLLDFYRMCDTSPRWSISSFIGDVNMFCGNVFFYFIT